MSRLLLAVRPRRGGLALGLLVALVAGACRSRTESPQPSATASATQSVVHPTAAAPSASDRAAQAPTHTLPEPAPSAERWNLESPEAPTPGRGASCACAERKNREQLQRARARAAEIARRLDPEKEGLLPPLDDLLPELPCWDTPSGAWAYVASDALVCPATEESWDRWETRVTTRLTHLRGGERCRTVTSDHDWPLFEWFEGDRRFDSKTLTCSVSAHPDYPAPVTPLLFDFDGDGEPELWTGVTLKGDLPSGKLVTFDGNAIKPFAMPKVEARRIVDGDRDGRPDLLWSQTFDHIGDCGDSFAEQASPEFLAHALVDGSFSLDDGVAKEFARSWCPAVPKRIRTSADVVCARLFGKSTESVRAEVDLIPRYDCELELAGKDQSNASVEVDAMTRAASWQPPFQLSPGP